MKTIRSIYTSALSSNRSYTLALMIAMALSLFLNWNSDQMSGILPNYEDFKDYFKSGFDSSTPFTRGGRFTFPMWGYGFMLMLGLPKWGLMILQLGMNIGLLVWIDRSIARIGFSTEGRTAYRWLSVFAFPWHLIHANLWPYSEGAILIATGIMVALLFVNEWKWYQPLISGICFGLALNFRSDYYFFSWVMWAALIGFAFFKHRKALLPTLGFGSFLMLLLPWMLYSHMRTGHYLPTSTNAGHVFYIGLGQLPNNQWHITPVDEDPNMHHLLDSVLGKGSSSLDYEGDKILKKAWADSVKANPLAYVKKCGVVAGRIALRPFNAGSMNNTADTSRAVQLIREFSKYAVAILGLLVFWISVFFLVKTVLKEKLNVVKSWLLIPILAIAYQLALVIGAFFMPTYHTNSYLLYVLVLIYGLQHSTKKQTKELV